MNSLKLGLELKKLVFKRKLGAGEFSYVSVATGEERRGKAEILELLVLEDGWTSLLSCKSARESEANFMKNVKKQISFVLFEDQVVKNSDKNNSLPTKTLTNDLEQEPKENHDTSRSDPVIKSEESPKKRKAKIGPASKVKRLRSTSPESGGIGVKVDTVTIDAEDNLDVTVPFENRSEECPIDNDVLEKTVGLSNSEYYEEPAPVPKVEEDMEVEELPDIDEDVGSEDLEEEDSEEMHYNKSDEDRIVLIFNIDRGESFKNCKSYFSKFAQIEQVKRTKTRKNSVSEDLKFKGVYLVSFETEKAADDFLISEIQYKGEILTTAKLSEYKKEKFFQRQIQRCKVIIKKHLKDMGQLNDLKRSGKLNNCVSVQIPSAEVSDEQVQEFFCGLSSDFIDKFGKPIEEAKRLAQDNMKAFVEYILVFEEEEDAHLFVKNPEVHKFEDVKMRVLLLTDSMKRVRYSQKPKNFADDKQYGDSDNSRRVSVQTVNKFKSEEELGVFFKERFPNLKDIHRCEINNNFLGLYILTFEDEMAANKATKIDLAESDFVKNSMVTPLNEYIRLREKYLNQTSSARKKSNKTVAESPWKVDYQNIEKLHQEHWGDIETEYKSIYDRIEQGSNLNSPPKSDIIEQEGSNLHFPQKTANKVKKKTLQEFDYGALDVFVGCEGFDRIDERSKQEIEEYFYDNHENVASVYFTSLVFVKFKDLPSAERFFTLNYVRYKGREITTFKVQGYFRKVDQESQDTLNTLLFGVQATDDSDDTISQDSHADGDDEVCKLVFGGFLREKKHFKMLLTGNLGTHFGCVSWKQTDIDEFVAEVEVTSGPEIAREMVEQWNRMEDSNKTFDGKVITANLM